MKPGTYLPPVCAAALALLWLSTDQLNLSRLQERSASLATFLKTHGGGETDRGRVRSVKMPELSKPGYAKADGKPDWKKIGRKFEGNPNAIYQDVSLALAMMQLLQKMSAEELSAAMDEIDALDLPENARGGMLEMLAEVLSERDPQLLLARFPKVKDQLTGWGAYSQNMNGALQRWAAKDSEAASAWLDRMVAEGGFKRRGLDGSNAVLLYYESALISSGDEATVRDRIRRLPDDQLVGAFSSFDLHFNDVNRPQIAEAIRTRLPESEQAEALAKAAQRTSFGENGRERASEFMKQIEATPAERKAIIVQAFETSLYNPNSAAERIQGARDWAKTEAPDDVERITGQALANMAGRENFDQLSKLVLKYAKDGGDEGLIAFLDSPATQANAAKALPMVEKISDPVRREELRQKLTLPVNP